MRARPENVDRFRHALVHGQGENMLQALTHDFGSRENARMVLVYLSCAAQAWKIENRVMIAGSFVTGVLTTLVIGALVRVFS